MHRPEQLVIAPEMKGKRLDQALAEVFAEPPEPAPKKAAGRKKAALPDDSADSVSRSVLQTLIKDGAIKVDNQVVKPNHKLRGGETVTIAWPVPEPPATLAPTRLGFPILFEDDDLIVINKPVGLSVHPGAGREKESVVSALLSHTTLSPIGAPLRPGVVHRLDKSTSGVMVLAKTEKCHKRLVKLFSGHQVEKEYQAIVQGVPKEDRGMIEAAIERDRVNRQRMKVTRPDAGRMAKSHFEVLERLSGAAWVKVLIETGRTHQIRVHLSFIGFPLYGDVTYGGSRLRGEPVHFLHAGRLRFKHPISGEMMEWQAPLPEAFRQALDFLRIKPMNVERRSRR